MKEIKTLEELGEIWNETCVVTEVIQAIVNQSKYIQVLRFEDDTKDDKGVITTTETYIIEVDGFPTSGILIEEDDIRDAKFEAAYQFDSLPEAMTFFVGIVTKGSLN